MSGTEQVGRRRARRIAGLLAGILAIVCGASFLVYRGGVRSLEQRAEEELAFELEACRTRVHSQVEESVRFLTALAHQDVMEQIPDGDLDSEIYYALKIAHQRSGLFTKLACLDEVGRIVASTVPLEHGRTVELAAGAAELGAGQARLALAGRALTLTVPIVFEYDRPQSYGWIVAEAETGTLLRGDEGPLARLLGTDGAVLADQAVERPHAGLAIPAEHVHGWKLPELRVRTAPVEWPAGVEGPSWTVAVADCREELRAEAGLLGRMVLLLTSGTAGLVLALVLVFARFEARLNRRLEERALELEVLNQRLDRSRADLVKAARLAGMSEVATGILHNVGNVLNTLNVAAHQVGSALRESRLPRLHKLVDLLRRDDGGLGSAIRVHPKGGPFLDYLPALTEQLDADRGRALEELDSVRSSIDHISALVSSQQEYAKRSSVREEAQLSELVEGALVISTQVLGDREGLAVEREVEDRSTLVCRHRVVEILVNLINNARQSLAEAGPAEPVLTLAARRTGERLRFEVRDNGQGIPAEHLVEIFHHGFSTKAGGHGFGLHAASNAAAELGGTLSASSPGPGAGATFVLEVPFEPLDEGQSLEAA